MGAFLWLVAPFAYLLFTPVAGCLADKVAKWRLLFFGLILSGVALGFTVAIPSAGIALVEVCLALVGAGTAFVETPSNPLLLEIADARHPGTYATATALQDSAFSLAFILGPTVGSGLKAAFGLKWALVGTGAAMVLISPAALHLRKILPRDDPETDQTPESPAWSMPHKDGIDNQVVGDSTAIVGTGQADSNGVVQAH